MFRKLSRPPRTSSVVRGLVPVILVSLAAIGCGEAPSATNPLQAADDAPDATAGDATPAAKGGFALVELFTSEGCSSCPPADRLLAELDARAQRTGENVLVLGYHVDYWDRLGWQDRFATPKFTAMQRAYGKGFGLQSVYTPQMIVNGRNEFVGSDARAAGTAVRSALATAPRAEVRITATSTRSGIVYLDYRVSESQRGETLFVALVEPSAGSDVKRGENAGRELQHVNVVRLLEVVSLDDGHRGSVELTPPAGVAVETLRVVAWVRESGTTPVLGAAAVPVVAGKSSEP